MAIESSRPKKCWIEYFGPVGCRKNDNPLIGLESVHFRQELVKCLLSFVVTAHVTCSASFAQGVEFVYEDQTGRHFASLLKEVPDSGRA